MQSHGGMMTNTYDYDAIIWAEIEESELADYAACVRNWRAIHAARRAACAAIIPAGADPRTTAAIRRCAAGLAGWLASDCDQDAYRAALLDAEDAYDAAIAAAETAGR